MAKQLINTGAAANDGTGDTLRAASIKINSNFTEVYTTAEEAFNRANAITSLAQGAFDGANSSTTLAHSAFDGANSSTTLAHSAFDTANGSTTLAQSAFDAANNATVHSASLANGSFSVTLSGVDGSVTLPGRISGFGSGNAHIQAGMGFHISSEEGISLEAVNTQGFEPVTKSFQFDTNGVTTLPTMIGQSFSRVQTQGDVQVNANGALFTFKGDNTVSFPDGSIQSTAWNGKVLQLTNKSIQQVGSQAIAHEPSFGYGGHLAVFTGSDFTSGTLDSVQAGWTVSDGLGFTDVVASVGVPFGGAITLTNSDWPNSGGRTYTFSSADYVAAQEFPITANVNNHVWTFGADGSLTTPGPINTIVSGVSDRVGTKDPVYPTAIDLTKTINKLGDNTGSYYTLADGTEGQIMYLVKKHNVTDASLTSIGIHVANMYSGLNHLTNQTLYFNNDIITLIFTDGAWQQTGGIWD